MSEAKKPFNSAFAGLAKIKAEAQKAEAEKAEAQKRADAARAEANKRAAQKPPERAGDDEAAFFRAMAGVKALDKDHRGVVVRPVERPAQRPVESVERRVLDSDDDALMDLASSLDPDSELGGDERLVAGWDRSLDKRIVKRLKAGEIPFTASLDLHGHRRDQAERELEKFIYGALRDKQRCVQIITGKGNNSEDGTSVLKQAVADALSRGKLVKHVLAYAQCPPRLGGEGAYCVLLRRR